MPKTQPVIFCPVSALSFKGAFLSSLYYLIFSLSQAIFSFDATNFIFFPIGSILSPRTHSGLCKMKSPHHRLILVWDCLFVWIAVWIFDNGLNQGGATESHWDHDAAGFSKQPLTPGPHTHYLVKSWLDPGSHRLACSSRPDVVFRRFVFS